MESLLVNREFVINSFDPLHYSECFYFQKDGMLKVKSGAGR